MGRLIRISRLRCLAPLAGLGILAAGCGGGVASQNSPPAAAAAPIVKAGSGPSFSVFRVAQDASIDYLDPGLTYGPEAVEGTALECASVLAQALANRWGVVPSNILEDL